MLQKSYANQGPTLKRVSGRERREERLRIQQEDKSHYTLYSDEVEDKEVARMGQKVTSTRVLELVLSKTGIPDGIAKRRNFADNLVEDDKIQKILKKETICMPEFPR